MTEQPNGCPKISVKEELLINSCLIFHELSKPNISADRVQKLKDNCCNLCIQDAKNAGALEAITPPLFKTTPIQLGKQQEQ